MNSRILVAAFIVTNIAYAAADSRAVFVNRVRLSEKTIQALEQAYRVRLRSGNFWYDRVSGLWGLEGSPTAGQIATNLNLGGPLRADASKSKAGVFINGREIHEMEVLYLRKQYGQVIPGRYRVNGRGIGGVEGRPAIFNIGAASRQLGNDWIRRTPGGTVGGSGGCSYDNHPNGTSVMTGNCYLNPQSERATRHQHQKSIRTPGASLLDARRAPLDSQVRT